MSDEPGRRRAGAADLRVDVEKSRQVIESEERGKFDGLSRYAMTDVLLGQYGQWVASLAPWSLFITGTHDAKRLRYSDGWTRSGKPVVLDSGVTTVGLQRHRKMIREWFYDDVRRYDHSARYWGEVELHESGQAHEHGLLAVSENAPVLKMRQAWFERCGFMRMDPVLSIEGAARYVAKYTGKAAASEPSAFGFGLWRVNVRPGSWMERHAVAEIARARDEWRSLR